MGLRSLLAVAIAIHTGCTIADRAPDRVYIRKAVDQYVASINAADPIVAQLVWADDPAISLIHPLGHERGWAQIKGNFYEKLMGGMLTDRNLTFTQFSARLIGADAALVEFEWKFQAKLRANGSPVNTSGRESQVLRREGSEWKIMHVHYSPMPAAAPGAGF